MMAEKANIEIFNESGIPISITDTDAAFLISSISNHQNCQYEFVEVVYVDETEIVRVNAEFLKRDYVTDIISFRYDDDTTNQAIEGTLYCCAQRITEQANEFADSTRQEFLRVLIHGLIHLIGYDDGTPEEKQEMTKLEDHFLHQHAQLS